MPWASGSDETPASPVRTLYGVSHGLPTSFTACAGELRALLMGLALPTEVGEREEDGLDFWLRELDADRSRGVDAGEFHAALTR